MKASSKILEHKTALENEVLALLSQGAKDKIWSEREITEGLGHIVPICCCLERLQAAGKVKLTLGATFVSFFRKAHPACYITNRKTVMTVLDSRESFRQTTRRLSETMTDVNNL